MLSLASELNDKKDSYKKLCEISNIHSEPHIGFEGSEDYFKKSLQAIDDSIVLAY